MAGIYAHIPFCKSRCVYCGFFSTTSLEKRSVYVDAVVEELKRRRHYLAGEPIDTIYLGGGTPSVLPLAQTGRILDAIYNIYNVREGAEVTLEGNPDDLTPDFLHDLKSLGVNRLSMGVQTFDDARLAFLHRRHSARQAVDAVRSAVQAGFQNISIDLMFGFPMQTLDDWKCDVQKALSLGVQHISAYSLMYEEGTRLQQMLEAGTIAELDEEASLQMYEYLIDTLSAASFRHYEISNFALPGKESRHNSGYWQGVPYLGVGAGAHSYDGRNRHYNADSLASYLAGEPLVEEQLTENERYDEFVFTGLRTSQGLNLTLLEQRFGTASLRYCLHNAQPHLRSGRLALSDNTLRLTRQGLFVSNDIMSDLMQV